MKKSFRAEDIRKARDIFIEHSIAIAGQSIGGNEEDDTAVTLLLISLVEKLSDIGEPQEDVERL